MTAVGVVGLGYVGLPLVVEATAAGHAVLGVDASPQVVSYLNDGRSHVDDISDDTVISLLAAGFSAGSDFDVLGGADVIVICVPTPLSKEGGPDLTAVRHAGSEVAKILRQGQLVVLESTTYPGTTEEVLRPLLESSGLRAGVDFHLAFSPERIDPGNPLFGLRNTPKVVGGLDTASTQRATEFYRSIVDDVVVAKGAREAEMTKLLENTYRHINIALVNEMVRFCHELEIDLWDAIRCATTKPFGFSAFYPGPGVGGHCIPIDPNYLSHRVKTSLGFPFRFVELAEEINSGMPAYVARRTQDLLNEQHMPVAGRNVLLLGVTYKPDIADQRESPADDVALHLRGLGALVSYWDPFVDNWQPYGKPVPRVESLEDGIRKADVAIVLQAHSALDKALLEDVPMPVLDARGVLNGKNVQRL